MQIVYRGYISAMIKCWYTERGDNMAYTEAQARATKKYIKEKTDDIRLRVAKGTKELWKEEAEKRGMSMTKFVKSCVEKEIKNGDMLMF